MLQREELEKLKVDELRKMYKEYGFSYSKHGKKLTKAEMIEELPILVENMMVEEKESKSELSDEIISEIERKERKQRYIENASIGTLIAFELPGKKVISAMITKKSTKGRKFKTVTKYGAEHIVPYDKVLWVRTNKRWPKGVYLLFKKNVLKNKVKTEEV